MSSILFNLPELYSSYKNWVSQNPNVVGDFESTAKWLSYFVLGRINSSHVLSELIYSLSNLLVLFNDRIIQNTRRLGTVGSGEKLKIWLTVVDYSEVFIEVSARRLWGDKGKWLIVVIIQILKFTGRLLLLFQHQENMVQNPPMPPLQRKKLGGETDGRTDESLIRLASASFTLKRSGRVVRTVTAAPPTSCRTWRPLKPPNNNAEDDGPDQQLAGKTLVAEVLYIMKPLAHLSSMMVFGQNSWKPWTVALFMDLASLQLHKNGSLALARPLSQRQRLEISRRKLALLLYLIRSPFYEHHSRDRLQAFLHSLSSNLPLVRIVCNPLAQYIPQFQDTYFYLWSN